MSSGNSFKNNMHISNVTPLTTNSYNVLIIDESGARQ